MITDRDIEKLKSVFVTKDDLWQFGATFATKFATKHEFTELKGEVGEMKITLNQIMNILDGYAKRFDFHDMEYTALKMSDDRQNEQIRQLAKHTKYRFGGMAAG